MSILKKGGLVGLLIAVAAAMLFGIGGTFAQFLFERRDINIQWLVTVRLLGAGAILLALSALRDGAGVMAVWKDRRDAGQLVTFGVLGMLSVQYTYFAAIRESNTATATVLQFTAPAMIAAWLAMRTRKWPSGREKLAILLALAGTFVLVTHGNINALTISAWALFWGLASAVAAAFNSLQPVRLLHRHSASHVTAWGMLIGGVALSFVHQPWDVSGIWDGYTYGALVFIITFGSLIAFLLYMAAVRSIGAQKTSLLTCAEPLTAAVLAVLWLGVSFGPWDWLGTVLILATIFLLSKADKEEKLLAEVTEEIRQH